MHVSTSEYTPTTVRIMIQELSYTWKWKLVEAQTDGLTSMKLQKKDLDGSSLKRRIIIQIGDFFS